MTLGASLHQLAELYRRQANLRAALARTLMPPLLLIATAGVLVGVFVLSVMLPMFKLLDGLSR